MKLSQKLKDTHRKMREQDRLYGTTKLGARGQVVIPVHARKDLHLKPGDELLVMGKFGRALGLMKTSGLEEFVNIMMNHVAGTPIESEVKAYTKKFFGTLYNKK